MQLKFVTKICLVLSFFFSVSTFSAQNLCLDTEVTIALVTGTFGSEVSWDITDENGSIVSAGSDYESGTAYTSMACFTDGCYTLNMYDSFGDGWNGALITVVTNDLVLVIGQMETGSFASMTFGLNTPDCSPEPVFGCTDQSACNFNPEAMFDDQSCTYPGCLDPNALNYNENAGCEDDSCEYEQSCDLNAITINMYDSFGDNWNGATYTITDENGNLVAQGSLDITGGFDAHDLCLADGCFSIYVGGGTFDAEISWDIVFGDMILAAGGAPSEMSFGVNADGCNEQTFGCTDADACNYDPNANTNDESCTYPGCMDPNASNYDDTAGCSDDSCEYDEPCDLNTVQLDMYDSFGDGWNGATYLIFDESGDIAAEGTMEMNSEESHELCLADGCYFIFVGGGTFDMEIEWTISYNGVVLASGAAPFETSFGINSDDCNLQVYGCTDADACNYDATANTNDGSCTYPGCMDPEAVNYDSAAGCEDDSCEYIEDCDLNSVVINMYDSFGDNWNGATYSITDENGNLVAEGGLEEGGTFGYDALCLEDGCYLIVVGGGAFDAEIAWELVSGDMILATGGAPSAMGFGVNANDCSFGIGCTDSVACNYDAEANHDNGSCTYPGCTDPEADNYDMNAGCDDGSCETCEGETALLYVCTFGDGHEVEMDIVDSNGNVVIEVNDLPSGSISYFDLCLDPEECYTVYMYNNVDAGWNGGYYWINNNGGEISTGALADDASEGSVNFSVNGTCPSIGCTDPEASNYDPNAIEDDGSCLYPEPCDDNMVVINMYDSFGDFWNGATYSISDVDGNEVANGEMSGDDGSFDYNELCLADGCYTIFVGGGTFDSEISWEIYSMGAMLASGTAMYPVTFGINDDGCAPTMLGCTDNNACNFDPNANADDQSCTYPGCMDPEALNYNPFAGCEDDSCEYDEPCDMNVVTIDMYDTFGDGWNGAFYVIIDAGGNLYAEGTMNEGSEESHTLCLDDGCYSIFVGGGTFDMEIEWAISYNGNMIASGGGPSEAMFGINSDDCNSQVYGCTDDNACNFDPNANAGDQSCTYPGCMDPEALNYNPFAGCEDDSCEYDEPCDMNMVTLDMYDSFGDGWNAAFYMIMDTGGNIVAEGTLIEGAEETHTLCLADGCYSIFVGGGTFDMEVEWTISHNGVVLAYGSAPEEAMFGINTDDCNGQVYGCTDDNACNFDPNANADDQSCTYPGCLDPEALNYNPFAGCEDDSCEYEQPCEMNSVTLDMFDSWGDGWNGAYYSVSDEDGNVVAEGTMMQESEESHILCLADGCYSIYVGGGTFDMEIEWMVSYEGNMLASGGAPDSASFGINADGCNDQIYGCTDDNACNFDPNANSDDQSCTYPGCMDPEALNYNPFAGCEDDSCEYDEACDMNEVALDMYDTFGDGWNGAYYAVSDEEGNVVAEGTMEEGSEESHVLCLADGCYSIYVGGGTFDMEIEWMVSYEGNMLASGGAPDNASFGINAEGCNDQVYGCTDVSACNYDSNANTDDQSCTYPGCMDPEALNYNPFAGCEDDSCEYEGPCEANALTLWIHTEIFASEVSWTLANSNGDIVAEGSDYESGDTYTSLCLEDDCYTFTLNDSFGDGWNGAFYMMYGDDGLIGDGTLMYGSSQIDILSVNSECEVDGCTDPTAYNFEPWADINDGSCLYGPGNNPGLNLNNSAGFAPSLLVSVSPNPVVSSTTVKVEHLDVEAITVFKIYDLSGKLISEKITPSANATMVQEFDLQSLESGIYLLQVQNGNQIETAQFVKMD